MKARELAEVLVGLGPEHLNKTIYIVDESYEGPYFLRTEVHDSFVSIVKESLPYEQFPYKFVGPRRKPKWWSDLNDLKSRNLWPTGAGEPQP